MVSIAPTINTSKVNFRLIYIKLAFVVASPAAYSICLCYNHGRR